LIAHFSSYKFGNMVSTIYCCLTSVTLGLMGSQAQTYHLLHQLTPEAGLTFKQGMRLLIFQCHHRAFTRF